MKKKRVILTVVFITAVLAACNMVPWEDIVSLNINPTLINKVPRVYPGGNAECSTINIPGLVQTTGRNNYVPSTDGFEKGWPSGLLVKVDNDKSVSFQIDGAINIGDGKYYKVGAVIVKGSDASNVYDYTDLGGVTMDKGLVPPNNSSGTPAGLSNLTFCFVECPPPPQKVITVKVKFSDASEYAKFGVSEGTNVFTTGWCADWYLGVNDYVIPSSFILHQAGYPDVKVGDVIVLANGDVKIDLNDGFDLINAALFVGTLDDLKALLWTDNCPLYTALPWKYAVISGNEFTFDLP